jgi:hypothetical protein
MGSSKARGRPKGLAKAPETGDRRAIVLSIKGTAEYRDWLAELADHCRSTSVQVIDAALVAYAKHVGFAKTAPKRTEGR